ncbi:hypothetical protein RFI_17725 [Reticulomyxa filosa]|uniref:Uncharacterized protein n=1 Tax=Reticulomyxa filosa TaxID=46433 RepID=X6N1B0_RETFI|nr:hypothetical protein RFI_17725 [Reticulomyxa filosa]|eukprot:ETO19504.1 hypothetical protein RFI_17725 [Reticulomyxa filosa]
MFFWGGGRGKKISFQMCWTPTLTVAKFRFKHFWACMSPSIPPVFKSGLLTVTAALLSTLVNSWPNARLVCAFSARPGLSLIMAPTSLVFVDFALGPRTSCIALLKTDTNIFFFVKEKVKIQKVIIKVSFREQSKRKGKKRKKKCFYLAAAPYQRNFLKTRYLILHFVSIKKSKRTAFYGFNFLHLTQKNASIQNKYF